MLQKALHKGDVIAIIAVDLCRIPFAEAVGADPLIAQVITDASKDLLHFPCRDGEDQIEMLDAVAQAVILNVLLDYKTKKTTEFRWFSGRGRRLRTLGLRFWRPPLYQLSYSPMFDCTKDGTSG